MVPPRRQIELCSRHKRLEESLAVTHRTTVPRNISTA
jgi:hypothetical protein